MIHITRFFPTFYFPITFIQAILVVFYDDFAVANIVSIFLMMTLPILVFHQLIGD